MVTEGCLSLQWVTYGNAGIHMATVGYISLQWIAYGYTGLHIVTVGYIWLHWFKHGYSEFNMVMLCYIKTSGSESRPRKVELASAHKKNATTTASILHITTKLVKTPTKQPYRIYIFIS